MTYQVCHADRQKTPNRLQPYYFAHFLASSRHGTNLAWLHHRHPAQWWCQVPLPPRPAQAMTMLSLWTSIPTYSNFFISLSSMVGLCAWVDLCIPHACMDGQSFCLIPVQSLYLGFRHRLVLNEALRQPVEPKAVKMGMITTYLSSKKQRTENYSFLAHK